ncbi:MAG: aminotransferase class V-fold PLP-dependent enzyme [Acidobacteriaceae bacterium]
MLKDFFLLDPQVIFLNHGSYGACPRPVFERYQVWQRLLERQPVQFLGTDLDAYLKEARQKLGEYIHAPANDLVYIPNATTGINIIAHSLRFAKGDEILATDQEYGACNYTWEFLCEKSGAIYKTQPVSFPVMSEQQILEQFWQGVTPKTRLIYFSHVASPTSLIFPARLICQKARQEGILTLVDGAHAPGQLDLDLISLQADFYVGNCHKWMMSPKGVGFLYARPEVQEFIEPLVVSWGYQSRTSPPKDTRFIDYLQWSGTKDFAAALSVPAAIEFMQEYHWGEVRQQCHSILAEAISRAIEVTGSPPLYPADSNFYQQMGTLPLPRIRDLKELKERLLTDYRIEIPYIDWKNQHFLRLSVQGYNTADEIELLMMALTELLPNCIE